MKGFVFTELLAMAEEAIGEARVDAVLDRLALESDGAYTAVGNYPCGELMQIVEALSVETGLAGAELQRRFGHWVMQVFRERYGGFFEGKRSALEMLEAVEGEVHVEVRKLYPDAELPRFVTTRDGQGGVTMDYRSPRPLVPFCLGLIEACGAAFGTPLDIVQVPLPGAEVSGARFHVRVAG
ncbi:heme NO-binding domain-containing protein [Tropicibacter sp. S64]|uniref:heme NO-binding domain-containing protein n=1 Tax=Tropicibacter sp. S64 TaxID=3415122 RepID=UPI003C7E648A